MSPERVVERTRLPKSTIDRIAPPILQENAERAAIREAEHAVKREQQKILKEKYPCPLCHKGYGIADGGVLTAFLDGSVCRIGTDADAASKGGAFFRPYYAHCSNKRCVAQLIFPRDSREDAVTFSPACRGGGECHSRRVRHDTHVSQMRKQGSVPQGRQPDQPQQGIMVLLVEGRLSKMRGENRQLVSNTGTGAGRVRSGRPVTGVENRKGQRVMGLFQFLHREKHESEPVETNPNPIDRNKLKAVMYGLTIGDALGVPYEFQQRDTFTCAGMTGHGTHNQPAGTWSDDTAMSLATLDSLNKCGGKVDTADLMMRYGIWLEYGMYMPDGITYDVGVTVATAINSGHGCDGYYDNGNGSLMRVAPCAFYHLTDGDIRRASAVTHANEISTTACVRYVRILEGLLNRIPPREAIENSGLQFDPTVSRTEVQSDGFVLHTLNAAIWCLTNTNNYRDCVLTAVNLGEDTDTTASVAGALAGAVYGLDGIPSEWIMKLRKSEIIDMYVLEAVQKEDF